MQPRRRPILWRGCRFCLVVFDSDTIPPFLRTERKTYPHTPVSRKGPDFAIGGEVMRMARVLHRSPLTGPHEVGPGVRPGGYALEARPFLPAYLRRFDALPLGFCALFPTPFCRKTRAFGPFGLRIS